MKAVQRHLGHATATQTLDRYAHLFTDDLEAVAERLEEVWAAGNASSASWRSFEGHRTQALTSQDPSALKIASGSGTASIRRPPVFQTDRAWFGDQAKQ